MTACVNRCVNTLGRNLLPARRSWTRNRSRRRKKGAQPLACKWAGAQRLRRGQKEVKGRKRHIAVDTLGLLLVVVVHCAGIQDRDGAKLLCKRLSGKFPRLGLLWADGGYAAGQLIAWVRAFAGWALQIVKRSDRAKGFVVLPRRWVVERTFAWLIKFRRLSRDYEETTTSSEAWIRIAMIHIMVRRLA